MNILEIIKTPYNAFLNWRDFNIFKKKIGSFAKGSKLVIFDIDNTITCTWPSLLVTYPNEKSRVLSLAVNLNCLSYLKEKISNENYKVFFLSHRSFKIKHNTIDWLTSVLDFDTNEKVFFTSSPKMKLNYLEFASARISNIEFIDDLSFNHEKGARLLYDEVINKVRGFNNVEYKGVDFLEKLDNENYYFKSRI